MSCGYTSVVKLVPQLLGYEDTIGLLGCKVYKLFFREFLIANWTCTLLSGFVNKIFWILFVLMCFSCHITSVHRNG